MMIKRTKIKGLNIKFVLRHQWEKVKFPYNRIFRRKEIGVWYEKNYIVGSKNFHDVSQWENNLVPMYMVGIQFIFFKAWITIDYKGKSLKV
jgi:hypothetical protein